MTVTREDASHLLCCNLPFLVLPMPSCGVPSIWLSPVPVLHSMSLCFQAPAKKKEMYSLKSLKRCLPRNLWTLIFSYNVKYGHFSYQYIIQGELCTCYFTHTKPSKCDSTSDQNLHTFEREVLQVCESEKFKFPENVLGKHTFYYWTQHKIPEIKAFLIKFSELRNFLKTCILGRNKHLKMRASK